MGALEVDIALRLATSRATIDREPNGQTTPTDVTKRGELVVATTSVAVKEPHSTAPARWATPK